MILYNRTKEYLWKNKEWYSVEYIKLVYKIGVFAFSFNTRADDDDDC